MVPVLPSLRPIREKPSMFAMRLQSPRTPLQWEEMPDPTPGPGQARAKVLACGVCRTDLHVVDGDLPHPKLP